jgi:hypothetical protein
MGRAHSDSSNARLKAFLAATVAAAIAIGLLLPLPHKGEADQPARSQFVTVELGG